MSELDIFHQTDQLILRLTMRLRIGVSLKMAEWAGLPLPNDKQIGN